MDIVSNCPLNSYLSIHYIASIQPLDHMREVSLCGREWLVQKFTTDQSAETKC